MTWRRRRIVVCRTRRHKRICYGTLTDANGHIIRRGRFSSEPQGLNTFMEGVEEAKIAMEAGYCWQPIYDALKEKGYDVRLAHPKKVKAFAKAKAKTDNINSETLAHLLRADLLPESYVPPMDIRELRDLVMRWAFLVGMRTKIKNRVHAELARRGIDLRRPLFTASALRWTFARLREPGCEAIVPPSGRIGACLSIEGERKKYQLHIGAN